MGGLLNKAAAPSDTFAGSVYIDLNGDGQRGCYEPTFKDYIVKLVACDDPLAPLSMTKSIINSMQTVGPEFFGDFPSDIQYYTILEHCGRNGGWFSLELANLNKGFGFLFFPGFANALIEDVKVEFFLPMEYDVSPHFPFDTDLSLVGCDEKSGLCKYNTECFPVENLTKGNVTRVNPEFDDSMPNTFGFAVEKNEDSDRCKAYNGYSPNRKGHGRYSGHGYSRNSRGGW